MISQDDIPEGWEINNLGEFIESNGVFLTDGDWIEKDDMDEDGQIGIVQLGQIERGKLLFDDVSRYITRDWAENNNCTIAKAGDIVISRMSPVLGGAIVPEHADDFVVPVDAMIARGLKSPTKEYLTHYLNCPYSIQFGEHISKGATRTRVSQSDARELPVPVPPLDEQECIVQAVEGRLERVEQLEKSVENVGRLANEYEDSLLSYLLTGRNLYQEEAPESEDWFGQIPEDWEIKELREIGSRVSSMTEPESGDTYNLYSFDSVDNVSGYYEVDGGEIGSRKRELDGGEVMISRLNPRINRVQKVDEEHKYPPIASSEFVVIDIEDYVNKDYVYEYLRNPILQERLTNHVTGSTGSRSRVGFDFVMDSNIPVPPKNVQQEIVDNIRRVDFGKLEKSYSDVSNLFDEYRNSVLSHAFTGGFDC